MLLKRLFQQSIQSWTGRVSLSTTSVPSLLISPSFVPSHPFFFSVPDPSHSLRRFASCSAEPPKPLSDVGHSLN